MYVCEWIMPDALEVTCVCVCLFVFLCVFLFRALNVAHFTLNDYEFQCKWKKMIFLNRRMRFICIGCDSILAWKIQHLNRIWLFDGFGTNFILVDMIQRGWLNTQLIFSLYSLAYTHNNCRIYHAGNSFTYSSFFFFYHPAQCIQATALQCTQINGIVVLLVLLPLPLPDVIATAILLIGSHE